MEYPYKTESEHVVAGSGAGVLDRVLDAISVVKDWLGPHLSAGLMVGGGLALTGAGLAWQSSIATVAGIGLAAGGVYSLVTQAAIDVYGVIDGLECGEEEMAQGEHDVQGDERNDEQPDEQLDTSDELPDGQPTVGTRVVRTYRNAAKRARKARKAGKRRKGAKRRSAERPAAG